MAIVPDIGPQELKRRLDAGETLTVLDVREPWEIKLASLPGTLNIPLNEVPARLGELDPHAELIVMCHAGGRSRRAAEFLSARGFTRRRQPGRRHRRLVARHRSRSADLLGLG